MTKSWRGVRRSFLAKVAVVALVAAVAVCFGGLAFAHEDGIGDDPDHPGHGPHDPLPSYLTPAGAGIFGTAHDFEGLATPGCYVCHDGPTWNHELSVVDPATYGRSDTVSFEAAIGDPGLVSLECLDCHDGTVPVDAFGGDPGTAGDEILPTDDGYLGTNLRHHHPVGISYSDDSPVQLYPLDGENRYGTINREQFGLDDGMIECTTCHNQHTNYQANNPDNEPGRYSDVHEWGHFVRLDHLCFQCHQRYQDNLLDRNPVPYKRPGIDTVALGHHFPGRDDPMGFARGTGTDPFEFACNSCHDIDGTGFYAFTGGDNSACTKCHVAFDPQGAGHLSPANPASQGHHGGDRSDPFGAGACDACHADPDTGLLSGAPFGSISTPSCGHCHADVWSDRALVVTVENASGAIGQLVALQAEVARAASFVEGEELVLTWSFGDGTPVQFPVTATYGASGWDGLVSPAHVFPEGVWNGTVTVTDGLNAPVIGTFTVTVGDVLPADSWAVDDSGDAVPDFDITFEAAVGGAGGVFTAVKDDGSASTVAFGIEFGSVIFWIDMDFTVDSWGVGNTYFGNIDRDGGTMGGVVIQADGTVAMFSGSQN